MDGSTDAGAGLMTTSGNPTTAPTIMTQANTTRDPSIRLLRDEHRVAVAHRTAANRPPTMAVIEPVWGRRASRRRVGAGGRAVIPSAFAPGTHPRAAAPIDTSDPY